MHEVLTINIKKLFLIVYMNFGLLHLKMSNIENSIKITPTSFEMRTIVAEDNIIVTPPTFTAVITGSHFMPKQILRIHYKIKNKNIYVTHLRSRRKKIWIYDFWRREWDSNPRFMINERWFSRPLISATHPSLRHTIVSTNIF